MSKFWIVQLDKIGFNRRLNWIFYLKTSMLGSPVGHPDAPLRWNKNFVLDSCSPSEVEPWMATLGQEVRNYTDYIK